MFSRNFAESGAGWWYGDTNSIFWWSSGHRTVCTHDFTIKYMTTTRTLTGGILKILNWAYLKYCQLIW